jgi:hypothetical protein
MGRKIAIIFMFFVTLLAIYIVYQPESHDVIDPPVKNKSSNEDYSIKALKKNKKDFKFWLIKSKKKEIIISHQSKNTFHES